MVLFLSNYNCAYRPLISPLSALVWLAGLSETLNPQTGCPYCEKLPHISSANQFAPRDSLCTSAQEWGLGFGVWGLGFGVWASGFGVWGLGFGVWGLGFRASEVWALKLGSLLNNP